jgi:hypothetical protein
MSDSQNFNSNTTRISKKIESAVRSGIKCYEKQRSLNWCHGGYDSEEIEQAAEMLLKAIGTEVCICIGYINGYRNPSLPEEFFSEQDHRTTRIHLHGNAETFTVELREPGSCTIHENVLIPRIDPISKGKAALLQEADNGYANAMFALSRLFDEGIGEPQDPIEAYFWHFVGMEFCEYDLDGEEFVDAAADRETLAAKLPRPQVNENSPLHKRAAEWIRTHRARLPDWRRQNGMCFNDFSDEIDGEQDETDEG